MTDLTQGQDARSGAVIASPSSMRSMRGRPRVASADSGRSTARAVLDGALSGIELTGVDRRFLSRLCQWDKRTATELASLVARARQRGRGEAGLAPEQIEVMLAALMDAFAYRTSGAASAGCWECASRTSGLCPEHARDADRARGFADLAAALSCDVTPATLARLDAVRGYQRQAAVAS